MKRFLLSLIVLPALALLLNACVVAPVIPPVGWAYTDFRAPLDINYQATPVNSPKTGKAESMCILGMVATGDASAEAAARNAGISTIEHADYEFFNVLGVYQVYRTVVSGR